MKEGRGWPDTSSTRRPQDDSRQHDKDRSRQTSFQETSADRHLQTFMVAEPVRETRDLRRVVRQQVEVETSRIIKKITLDETSQEKINHETEHIKISQNQHADKAVDVIVVIQRQLPRNQTMHRKQPDK